MQLGTLGLDPQWIAHGYGYSMRDVAPTSVGPAGSAYSSLEGEPLIIALGMMWDGASLSNEDGVICYANRAEERLFGYGAGELVGLHVSCQNAYSDSENERVVRGVMADLNERGQWTGEWLNRRKDGSAFLSKAEIRRIQLRGAQYWLCIRREHGSLQEQQLSIAAQAANLGIWEWDVPANAFAYSRRAREICGFPLSGDVTYEDVVRATHPEDFPWTSAQAKRALDPALRDRTPYEYRIVRPDGAVRWVRAHGYAVFSELGETHHALRYVGTLEDITERVVGRRRDHEASRQMQLAMESARAAVWSVDLSTGRLRPSPEFNTLFGFGADATPSIEEVEARYAPGVREALHLKWQDALTRRQATFETEYKIVRSGQIRCLHVRCEVTYQTNGAPDQAIGIVMDITEQQQARDALRESDARFREAADSAPAPVWMTGKDGKVEFGNRALIEFAGLPEKEAMGDTWLSLVHPEDLAEVIRKREQAWAEGYAPYSFEARFRRADGAWRWLEVNSRARFDAAGEFRGYVGLAVDRTEARQARETLAESEERFRLLADSAPVMIWMSDHAGRCQYLNDALRRFWNVEASSLGAFDWRTMMHVDDQGYISATVATATSNAEPFVVEGRYRDAQGRYRIIRTTGVPRRSAQGDFVGMIGVNVDLTDLIEAREQQTLLLEELNHRVKNTLAIVQSLAKQTFRSDGNLETAAQTFDARLGALAGAHTLLTQSNWESARLHDIVGRAILICGEARERVTISGSDRVLAPKQALSLALALHELCTNAIKHGALSGQSSGSVAVGWSSDGNDCLVFEWRETNGPITQAPKRRGFGVTLLERVLPRDVGGEASLQFHPNGVAYRLSMPVARSA